MRIIKTFLITALLVLLACLLSNSAQAQTNESTEIQSFSIQTNSNASNDPAQSAVSMYSQYYSMTGGSAPKTHIMPPKNYPIKNMQSVTVYFSVPKYAMTYTPAQTYAMPNQYQTYTMPYSQYQSNYATYTGGNSLWIQGATSLTQYAVVPQGASLSLIAITPAGGNGYLYEIAPEGKLTTNSYYFYPYNQIGFYANTIGQHILLFVIDDKVSNAIIINVVSYSPSNYQMPSSQYQAPSNQYQTPSNQYQTPSSQYQSSSSQSSGYGQTGY